VLRSRNIPYIMKRKGGDKLDYGLTHQLTEISAKQLDFVTRENLTPQEAVAFLRSGMQLRTFRDILRQVCGSDALEKNISYGLWLQDQSQNPDSVCRKVRNWMNGKNLPTEREDVFRICFALGLQEDRASRMLTLLTEQGIHYRNIREMVYAYCLRYRLGYDYARCTFRSQRTAHEGTGH